MWRPHCPFGYSRVKEGILLLVTGAALFGVSALRYCVVWVDGWDRPCELPLSLTLNTAEEEHEVVIHRHRQLQNSFLN